MRDSYVLGYDDLLWAHKYWSGEEKSDRPHWEQIVEGRGVILTTALRQRALKRIEDEYPHLPGELEIGRLAAELGSDLNVVAPFVLVQRPGTLSSEYFLDARDHTADFMTRLENHIRMLPRECVHWVALDLLRNGILHTPDLRKERFELDLDILSNEGRLTISTAVSPRDTIDWSFLKLESTPSKRATESK
jgi:hypothetical protein